MSIDTEITGSPSSIEALADRLKQDLAKELSSAGDSAAKTKGKTERSWQGDAGNQCVLIARNLAVTSDKLARDTKTLARNLDEFAASLKSCQDDMAKVREDAAAAKLTVSGFEIQHPGAGPKRPPDGFVGTEAEVERHNAAVDAYDAHQDLLRAYAEAEGETARILRKYDATCRTFEGKYTGAEITAGLVDIADAVGEVVAREIAERRTAQISRLRQQAVDFEAAATRVAQDMKANPGKYRLPRFKFLSWATLLDKYDFFTKPNTAKIEAARKSIADYQARADVARQRAIDKMHDKLPRRAANLSKGLGALGLGLGVYNDYQEGEPTEQIIASQGGGLLAGMALGAAAGTAIPVPVVGTVAGAVTGLVVSAWADGAIDSLFENGPDVGKALSEGVDAVADTGKAIGQGASKVADSVGGAAKKIGGWFS